MPMWFRVARTWLPLAVAITAIAGLAYVIGQQNYRAGLNDPQLQIARDGAAALDSGAPASSILPSRTVEMASSLRPFVIVYSSDSTVIGGTGKLSGSTPTPPSGVLEAARSKGENRVTWQPQRGVRIASVSVAARDGRVVLAGRNMSEGEARISALDRLTGLAWLAGLVGSLLVAILLEALGPKMGKT
jgi:hypothetical protein